MEPAYRFALAVVAASLAFTLAFALGGGFDFFAHPRAGYFGFAAAVIAGELFLLRLPTRHNMVLISASSLFAYATALDYGAGAAIVALCSGSLVKDVLRDHRPAIKCAFNAAQHALVAGSAGLVFGAAGGKVGEISAAALPPAIAGAAVYLVVNFVLTGTVVALASGVPIRVHLTRSLSSWLPPEGVMLGFAPIVALVASTEPVLLALTLLPLIGVVHSARIATRADHAALHDALTGLPNRVLFRRHVEQALARATHTGAEVAVLMLDLDGFKEVNDSLGHGRGDELLRGIAQRLEHALRDADVVARLGGDEFGVVVAPDAPGQLSLETLAARIMDALEQPFQLGDLWISAGASMGVACVPEHAADAETVIQRADVAMYLAKHGQASWEVYDTDRDPNRPGNLRLLQELRTGIEAGELVLHYQPKVAVATGEVLGVEALVRWQHPTRGLLYPGDFVALAERTDLIRLLTLRVVRDAVRQAAAWRATGLELPVAVNLSPRVLMDVGIAADIASTLAEEGLPARLLEVEIVESLLIEDPDRTAGVLERLSETGMRVTIDDFGTGYSSLSLLKRLPVDTIKIDRSFVGDLGHDPNDIAIVESTIALAGSLGLSVVAEGVETPEAWERLVQFGCDEAQGFYVCRPIPAAELETWLEVRSADVSS